MSKSETLSAHGVDPEYERPFFEATMLAEGRITARAPAEYGGKYRFIEDRWQGWLSCAESRDARAASAKADAYLIETPDGSPTDVHLDETFARERVSAWGSGTVIRLFKEPAAGMQAPAASTEATITVAEHEKRLANARESARTFAFRDMTRLFPQSRGSIANLLTHKWEITAIEMRTSFGVEDLMAGRVASAPDRWEAEIDAARKFKSWPRPAPSQKSNDGSTGDVTK
jgi:hypothetical protein